MHSEVAARNEERLGEIYGGYMRFSNTPPKFSERFITPHAASLFSLGVTGYSYFLLSGLGGTTVEQLTTFFHRS